jgi:hypothetical protein
LLVPVWLGVAADGQWLDPARDESAVRKVEHKESSGYACIVSAMRTFRLPVYRDDGGAR